MSSGIQLATGGIIARNLRSQGVSLVTDGMISYTDVIDITINIKNFILYINQIKTIELEIDTLRLFVVEAVKTKEMELYL